MAKQVQQPKIVQEYVKYKFSEAEKKDISAEMAEKIGEASALEDEKKALTKDFGGRIDIMNNEISISAQELRQGYTMRKVDCMVEEDFKKKRIYHMRCDTGEVVRTKPMRSDDLQMTIPGVL